MPAYHRWRTYTVRRLYTPSNITMLPHLMTLWNYALWVEQDCMCRANQDMSIFFNEPMRKKNKQITYLSNESGHMFEHRHKIWNRSNLNSPKQSVILPDWVDWVFEKLIRELMKKEVGDKSLNSDSRCYLLYIILPLKTINRKKVQNIARRVELFWATSQSLKNTLDWS